MLPALNDVVGPKVCPQSLRRKIGINPHRHDGTRAGIVLAALMKYYLNNSRVDAISAANRPQEPELGGLFECEDCR